MAPSPTEYFSCFTWISSTEFNTHRCARIRSRWCSERGSLDIAPKFVARERTPERDCGESSLLTSTAERERFGTLRPPSDVQLAENTSPAMPCAPPTPSHLVRYCPTIPTAQLAGATATGPRGEMPMGLLSSYPENGNLRTRSRPRRNTATHPASRSGSSIGKTGVSALR